MRRGRRRCASGTAPRCSRPRRSARTGPWSRSASARPRAALRPAARTCGCTCTTTPPARSWSATRARGPLPTQQGCPPCSCTPAPALCAARRPCTSSPGQTPRHTGRGCQRAAALVLGSRRAQDPARRLRQALLPAVRRRNCMQRTGMRLAPLPAVGRRTHTQQASQAISAGMQTVTRARRARRPRRPPRPRAHGALCAGRRDVCVGLRGRHHPALAHRLGEPRERRRKRRGQWRVSAASLCRQAMSCCAKGEGASAARVCIFPALQPAARKAVRCLVLLCLCGAVCCAAPRAAQRGRCGPLWPVLQRHGLWGTHVARIHYEIWWLSKLRQLCGAAGQAPCSEQWRVRR